MQVYCVTCAKHLQNILAHPNLKGQAAKDAQKYAKSTSYITKFNLERHSKGEAHRTGIWFEEISGKPKKSSEVYSTEFEDHNDACAEPPAKQPRIDTAMDECSLEARRKLLNTAYLLAVDGMSLSKFKTLIQIQKANGIQLIKGCDDSKAARELIKDIATAIRGKLKSIIENAQFFSLLSDGSQAKKTNAEKELFLVRIVRDGVPIFYCVALEHIDSYGNANADNIMRAIHNTFKQQLMLSEETFKYQLVSATSDGASVNTGCNNGVIKQLKDSHSWLLGIHCASHRLELAIKDSLMKNAHFKELHDFLVVIYYTFKKSGKLKGEFKRIGEVLGLMSKSCPKCMAPVLLPTN